MKYLVASILSVVTFGLLLSTNEAGEAKPKFTIKEVMQKANKGGLHKKVAGGMASDAEKQELVDLYVALNQNKPKKGEEKSWKEKTTALVDAAKAAQKGDATAGETLNKVNNCMACHKEFK